MRRASARGRIVPQSLSTDPRLGRLSLKAALLFPLMWINCDDQGRLSGDPDEIKYAACPNIDHITKADIPELLKELEKHGFIKVYATSKTAATQMLDWWEEQRLQWAYPSRYPPQEGWTDHLRYHPTPKEIITDNWPPSGQQLALELLPSKPASALPSTPQESPLTTPSEKERGKGKGKGKGRLPSTLGSRSPPSPAATLSFFIESFQKAWGRKPNTREAAQLRDLETEISSAGGTPEQIHDAFKEAAVQNKLHISYVRAILLDWLGVERSRSP